MLLTDHITRSGAALFRWRNVALLVALPLIGYATSLGEPLEAWLGETADAVYEAFCYMLVALGLAIRVWTAGGVPHGTSGRNRQS